MRHLFLLAFVFSSCVLPAQDQIIYLTGEMDYVTKIIGVQNDSLVYLSSKKYKKVPLTLIQGYYVTITTEENLARKFRERKRDYFAVEQKRKVR